GGGAVLIPLNDQPAEFGLGRLPGLAVGLPFGRTELDGRTVAAPELGDEVAAGEVDTGTTGHGRSPCGWTHVGKRLTGVDGGGPDGLASGPGSHHSHITGNGTRKGTRDTFRGPSTKKPRPQSLAFPGFA